DSHEGDVIGVDSRVTKGDNRVGHLESAERTDTDRLATKVSDFLDPAVLGGGDTVDGLRPVGRVETQIEPKVLCRADDDRFGSHRTHVNRATRDLLRDGASRLKHDPLDV